MTLTITGDSGRTYSIDLAKNYCTCPAWKFARQPAWARTCKHLEEIRSEIAVAADVASGRIRSLKVVA